jgi:hypothetical protein
MVLAFLPMEKLFPLFPNSCRCWAARIARIHLYVGAFGLIFAEFNVGLIWLNFVGCSGLGFGGDLIGAWGCMERCLCEISWLFW